MRHTIALITTLLFLLLSSCAQQSVKNEDPAAAVSQQTNPQGLDVSPDLSSFRTLELISNSTSRRQSGQARFVAEGAYVEVRFPESSAAQRLFVQVEDCRNSPDPLCQRRFVLSGDLMAFASRLKCYIQIRNDSNSGYGGQALQGLCQDTNSRSFAVTLSR